MIKIKRSSRYLHWTRTYLYRGTIGFIIIVAAAQNISAQTLDREQYGSQTILAKVLGDSPEQEAYLVTEEGLALNQATITNYLEAQGALQNQIIATPFGNDDIEGFLSITQGDSALVAPSVRDPEVLVTRRDRTIEHTVQSGDTISTIAEQYGISSNTVLWANNLTWSSTIRPGDTLSILPTSGLSYKVASGDTVSSIATKFQSDVDDIVSTNKLASASDISIGETLIVPNGVKPSSVQQVYKPTGSIFKNIVAPEAPEDSGAQFLWPLASHRITQYFSWAHTGLDVGDSVGKPIYAAENGKVIRAGWNQGYGYNVIVDHGNGIQTLYGHASELLVEDGQTVSRGETIALIGSTGWSTGPHLHFEVRINNSRVNPLNYLQ